MRDLLFQLTDAFDDTGRSGNISEANRKNNSLAWLCLGTGGITLYTVLVLPTLSTRYLVLFMTRANTQRQHYSVNQPHYCCRLNLILAPNFRATWLRIWKVHVAPRLTCATELRQAKLHPQVKKIEWTVAWNCLVRSDVLSLFYGLVIKCNTLWVL